MSQAVSYDDLEYLPNGTFLLDGKPFTGAAIDFDEIGQREAESHFERGRQTGIALTWYANGQLASEAVFVDSAKHGTERTWFENGALKSTTVFEFGFDMKHDEWNEQHACVVHYERKSTDLLYQVVMKKRAAKAAQSVPPVQ
ncbi:MAG: hypothetical protein AABZ53_15670 [Planctomycetota bacterium]